jgi:tetratricopeptide (TPR) repeat protein
MVQQFLGKVNHHILLLSVIFILSLTLNACTQGEQATNQPDVTSESAISVSAKAKEHYDNGVQFAMKGQFQEAIAEYRKSIEYNPDSAAAHSNLGFALFDSGEIEEAIVEQTRAIEIKPKYSNAYYGLAMAYEKNGNKTEAVNNWEKFLEYATPNSIWWEKAKDRLKNLEAQE